MKFNSTVSRLVLALPGGVVAAIVMSFVHDRLSLPMERAIGFAVLFVFLLPWLRSTAAGRSAGRSVLTGVAACGLVYWATTITT